MRQSNPGVASFRPWFSLAAAAAVLGAGAISGAHDEDWRKLRNRRAAVQAPAFRADLAAGGSGGGAMDGPFQSLNVELKSWLPLSALPGGGQGNASDCWGYVSPSGREYAIIGVQTGFAFVEVTNPGSAQVVGFVPGANSLWHDVDVVGAYAYGVSEGGLGIQVMDMTQIDSGVVTHVGNVQQGGHSTTHSMLADAQSGFLYLCGSNLGGLVVVSVANPTQPTIVAQWSGPYVHECLPVTYTSGPYAGKQIVFCFNGGSGLQILDVTNKSSIVNLGATGYAQLAYCHQGWLSPDRKYLYVDDELDEWNFGAATLTRVLNVENLSAPVLVDTFGNGLTSIDHNQYTVGRYLFQSNYTTGLRVWDALNPTEPVEIAHLDTHPEGNSVSFNGNWGNYPFFPSGTVVLSDMERGLFVVQPLIGSLAFEFPTPLPATVVPNAPTPVTVKVTSDFPAVASVKVFSRVGAGAFTETVMNAVPAAGVYEASLPATACPANVEFYFRAEALDGRGFTSPAGAPGAVHAAACGAACYPDCDGDGALTLADFGCFQTKFASGDPYADCNGDAALNLADFGCFQTGFGLGCP